VVRHGGGYARGDQAALPRVPGERRDVRPDAAQGAVGRPDLHRQGPRRKSASLRRAGGIKLVARIERSECGGSCPGCRCAPSGLQLPGMTIELTKTPSFRLDGRRALVTGGGRGIGLAAASALAAAGAHVTLAARTQAEIEAAAAAIRARGDAADALVLDVTDVAATRAAIEQAGPVHVLVNNARMNRPPYLPAV